ncbi:aryl-alcohol dehydrogenase [Scheffersomyces amazonensis]|uniref:aryl-alcohol dehydrogenase n=1 Tax=Scheffersomyces amazonensis TaxID=1078765 RepID=UPI00315C74C2
MTSNEPTVTYTKLGDSGLSISRVVAGCMSYGTKKWADWVLEDEEEIMNILKKCYDVGIRTFDTADVYSNGQSEILLGKFLKKYNIKRDRVVILTKAFGPVSEDDPSVVGFLGSSADYINSRGLSRKHIFDAVEASVRRLGTHIDVLQIHRLDDTPKHEIMKALNDVILSGQVRYIGASSMKAVDFVQLQAIADKNGWFKFISMQNYYNLLYREQENEMNYFCNDNVFGKVGLIPWAPIAAGVLAKPVAVSQATTHARVSPMIDIFGYNNLEGDNVEIINRVEELAKKRDVSMAVIATAWVLYKGANPIVGLNSIKRVEEAVQATQIILTEEEVKYLEEPYKYKFKVYF